MVRLRPDPGRLRGAAGPDGHHRRAAGHFIERWYSVGDTIQIPMHELQGVVEDFSLRHTRLRTLDGEVIHIHNSQIPSVQVLQAAQKELRLSVFVTDQEKGIEMVDSVASILPEGPTTFFRKPRIEQVDELSETLFRISSPARRSRRAVNGWWTVSSPTSFGSVPSLG